MKRTFFAAALAALTTINVPLFAFDEGDPAPPLSIERWVLGEPVRHVGKPGDNIYVIAFWATWAKPATESLFTLSEIQKEFSRSNVVVIAVSAEPAKQVEELVQTHPERKKLRIRIAVDDDQETTVAYMKAAGRGPLPHVFVVNKEGILAWQGHPLTVKPVLEQIIAEKFIISKQPDPDDLEEIDEELRARLARAAQAENWRELILTIDDIIKRYPEHSIVERLLIEKFEILYEQLKDYTAAEEFARDVLTRHSEKAQLLNDISWRLLALGSFERLDNRWPEIAHQAARKALEASKGESAAILDTYARSLYLRGFVDQAVAYQRKAVRRFRTDIDQARTRGDEPEQIERMRGVLRDMETSLEYYEQIAELRKRIRP